MRHQGLQGFPKLRLHVPHLKHPPAPERPFSIIHLLCNSEIRSERKDECWVLLWSSDTKGLQPPSPPLPPPHPLPLLPPPPQPCSVISEHYHVYKTAIGMSGGPCGKEKGILNDFILKCRWKKVYIFKDSLLMSDAPMWCCHVGAGRDTR